MAICEIYDIYLDNQGSLPIGTYMNRNTLLYVSCDLVVGVGGVASFDQNIVK